MSETSQADLPFKAGRYFLIEKLGEGHLGPVYKAVDPGLPQPVAIRFPAWGRAWDAADTRLVLKGCASLVTLRHQGILTVLDAGEEGGSPFIVTECTPDLSIDAEIKCGIPLTLEKKLFVMIRAAEALGFAHSRGLLHGNLKPSKIVLTSDGAARIRDVGLFRIVSPHLARPVVSWGDPIYLSPEQVQGGECSIRSDIFSAGVVFYEWLTGVHPFSADNGNRVLDTILHDDPAPVGDYLPDLPRGLWALLRRCLEKDPAARFGTMEEFASACKGVLEDMVADTQVMLSELLGALGPLRAAARRPGADPALQKLLRDIESLSTGATQSDYASLDRLLSLLLAQYSVVRAAAVDLNAREVAVTPAAGGAVSVEPWEPAVEAAGEPAPQAVREEDPTPSAPAVPTPLVEAPEPVAEPAPEPAAESAPEPVAESAPEPAAEPAPEPAAEQAAEPVAEQAAEAPGADAPEASAAEHGSSPVDSPVPVPSAPAEVPVDDGGAEPRPTTIVIARERSLPHYAKIAALLFILLVVAAGYLVKRTNAFTFLNAVWSRGRESGPVSPAQDSPAPSASAAREQAASLSVISSQTRAAVLVEEAERLRIAGKSAECRALLARALEIDPSQERALALMEELDGGGTVDPALSQDLAGVSAMIAAGQLPAARATLNILQRRHPGEPAILAARRRLEARIAREERERTRRDQELKEAEQARQRIEDEWSSRLRVLLREGRYGDAGRDVAQWLEQSPGSPAALGLRATIDEADRGMRTFDDALKAKRYAEALAALAAVEQANPSDANIAELRRRVEAAKASARASLSVYRLGARGTIVLDGKPLGAADEVEAESVAIGSHMLVVRGESVGSVSRAVEFQDGQKVVLVYDLRKQILRPIEDGDHQLLAHRRASEESHAFDVEHTHGVFRGSCRGRLLVGLPEIEFKPTAGTHRFRHPLRQLKLKAEGKSILLADATSGQEVFSFKVATPTQADALSKAWDRLRAYAK